MRRPILPIVFVAASATLLVFTAGCVGSSSGPAKTRPEDTAPFAAPMNFASGPSSGLWGDTSSGPSGNRIGCLPGRRYWAAVTLRNRSASTVIITDVGGLEPASRIIHRVAVQVRLAPPAPTGGAVGSLGVEGWSASPLVPVAIAPGKRAVVQANFLMRRCSALGPHQTLTANRAIVIAYRVGERVGHQELAPRAARILLTRGPTRRQCAPVQGAGGLIASDITCTMAEQAAVACHRLPHGTWGSCRATSREWDCTFTNESKQHELCWLPTKRQSFNVRWPDSAF